MTSFNFHGHRHAALLLLRIVVGAIFLYAGVMKYGFLTGEASAEGFMATIMPILAVVEPVFGVLLILGAFTAVCSVIFAIIMVGAMYVKISGGAGFPMWQIDLLLFAASLTLLTVGAGNLSVDAWRNSK